jgi:ribose transport system substrate-binding protein
LLLKCYVTYLQADELQFGRKQGDWLMEQLGCEGNLIVLNGVTGISTSDLRRQGLQEAIEACPDGGANVNILAEEDASWAYDQGKQATERMLAAYPEIDGVWSQGGAMTQGAIEAFEAAGRPLVPMTGEDNNGFMLDWQERIPDGFQGMAASEPTWQSRVALQAAVRILEGMPVAPFYQLQVPTIYAEDVDQYVRPDYSDAYWTNSLLPEDVADALYLKNE